MWAAGEWYNDGGKQFSVSVRNRRSRRQDGRATVAIHSRHTGSIVTRFPPQLRYLSADCSHYQAVASLPNELARPLLEQAIRERWNNVLRIEKKRVAGYHRPLSGGDVVDDLQALIRATPTAAFRSGGWLPLVLILAMALPDPKTDHGR
jgi:hypothetical protein